ncbi:MAG: PAS domain S-box protein, partial [Methanobacterium sp.]
GLTGEKIEVEVPIPTLGRIYNVSAYSPSHNHFIAIFSDITEHKTAEKALSQSQKLLQDIIDGFASPIFVKDIEGRFLTVNKNLEDLLGVKNEELKGKTDYDIITKELAEYYRANDQKVLEEGKAIAIEEEADLIDGHHTFIAHKFPIYDTKGKPYGVGSISTDITELKKIEDNLKESEERLRLAQTLGNVGIWDWNIITNVLHFTPELEQLYGLTPGTIKTYQDWRQLTHPDDIEKIEAERDEKIANHEPFDLEFRVLHKSGQIHWLSAKGGAIYNDEGDVLRVLGINEDITLRKKADKKIQDLIEQLLQANKEYQESEDRFQTLADNIPNLAWMADAEGWIFWYNKQWYEYTGTTLEEMQGWGWQKVHHPDYVDSVTEEWNTKLKNEEPYDNIFPLKGKDGNYRWFLTRIIPIRDAQGNLIRWFGTNTDVTERINHEKELEITMDELKRSNEELERFAYVSSHDLQEPLRMVTLYSQLLERRYKDSLDDDADDFIDYIVENAKRMKYLIDDLLEYSRVTSQAKEFENVDLEKVLEGVFSNLSILIVENNVTVTHDSLPTLLADKNQISQVFENLITNAIKFRGEEPPKIDISAQKNEKEWTFAFKDNGIGINPKHQEQIFEVFKRLHTREEYP